MIIYRDGHRDENPRALLRHLRTAARGVETDVTSHERVRDLLIEFGVFESGVADALNVERDTPAPVTDAIRDVSHQIGRMFVASCGGTSRAELRHLAAIVRDSLDALGARSLPGSIQVSRPEGYAYYALYPEQYVAAAARLVAQLAPASVVCIGVRAIGTSLSAVAAAALERSGCTVHSVTVRPRGHPFARTLALHPLLERRITADPDALHVIVDEGPGMSGSSFASVAAALTRLGIPDERIVFMPSWIPDGHRLLSRDAREIWSRHRKACVTFEAFWLADGRLARTLGADGDLEDIGAGAWRARAIARRDDWPAVQPQHEQRKYISMSSGRALLHRFSGLGAPSAATRERAYLLADAGFVPRPIACTDGFLTTEWLDARPLTPASADAPLLDHVARYVAFLARECPASVVTPSAQLNDMLVVNVGELLGAAEGAAAARFASASGAFEDVRPVAVDGHMAPHEWIGDATRPLKTDALDHHDDHFFPGSHDPAWDLAATMVEFDLTGAARRYLAARYASHSGDRSVAARVPACELAYLAFRAGYAAMAIAALEPGEEQERWTRALERYRERLRRRLASVHHAA